MIRERDPAGDHPLPFAPALLRLRFPAMVRRPEAALGVVDQCNGIGREVPRAQTPSAIPRGASIYVAGWIWSPAFGPGEAEVVVTIDGAFAAVATSGHRRPDVAEIHGNEAGRSGFEALIPSNELRPGGYTLGVARLNDGMSYTSGPARAITIVNSAVPVRLDLPVVPRMHIHVDSLADAGGKETSYAGAPVLRSGDVLRLTGWAADLAVREPSAGVYALVDDLHLVRGRYGALRADVAAELRMPQLAHCGFEIALDTSVFGIGDHDVRVVALSANGAGRSEAGPPQPFTVRAS